MCFHADETLVEHRCVSAAENEASRANIQSRMSLMMESKLFEWVPRGGREERGALYRNVKDAAELAIDSTQFSKESG
jgi:hypothetical protein